MSAKLDQTMKEIKIILEYNLYFTLQNFLLQSLSVKKVLTYFCSHTCDFLQVFDLNNHLTVTLKQTMVCIWIFVILTWSVQVSHMNMWLFLHFLKGSNISLQLKCSMYYHALGKNFSVWKINCKRYMVTA